MHFECNIVRRARVWDFFYFKGAKKHSRISNNSIISRRPSGGLGAREGVGNFKSEGGRADKLQINF